MTCNESYTFFWKFITEGSCNVELIYLCHIPTPDETTESKDNRNPTESIYMAHGTRATRTASEVTTISINHTYTKIRGAKKQVFFKIKSWFFVFFCFFCFLVFWFIT